VARNKKQSRPRIEFKGYIDCILSKEQKDDWKSRVYSDTEILDAFERLEDSGYRLGCSWDEYNECYSATLSPTDSNDPNAGYILTGRGRDARGAASQLLYKHLIVLDGDWQDVPNHSRKDWE
jgi:hypothetical protein